MIYYKGKLIPVQSATFTANNRALLYGDRIFETFLVYDQCIQFWQDHLTRLQAGMEILGLELEVYQLKQEVENTLRSVLKKWSSNALTCRLLVFRTEGGKYTPSNEQAEWLLYFSEGNYPTVQLKGSLLLSKSVKLMYSPWSRFKINSLPYVLAGVEKKRVNADDLLLLDTDGNMAECTMSNFFWEKDGKLFTPDLKTGCLEGVMRKHLFNELKKEHQAEEVIEKYQSNFAPSLVFSCNVSGISWFTSIDGQPIDFQGNVSERLEQLLKNAIENAGSHVYL